MPLFLQQTEAAGPRPEAGSAVRLCSSSLETLKVSGLPLPSDYESKEASVYFQQAGSLLLHAPAGGLPRQAQHLPPDHS